MDYTNILRDLSYFSKKKNKQRENNIEKHYNIEDYRFYKKRIFQLVKDIMQKRCKDETIIQSFDYFVGEAVEYLQFKDKATVLQEEYKDISLNNNKTRQKMSDISFNEIILYQKQNINKLRNNTVDIEKTGIVKRCSREKDKIQLPELKNVNLRDVKFKDKDIRKKNNVLHTYENKEEKQ